MTDTPIDFRPDGSIRFDIDDVTIRWRPPKVGHLRKARNAQSQVADAARQQVKDRAADDFDLENALEQVEDLVAGWVRSVHDDLRLEGDLPAEINEWPSWLPSLQFTLAVIHHWGTNPFASTRGQATSQSGNVS